MQSFFAIGNAGFHTELIAGTIELDSSGFFVSVFDDLPEGG